MDVRPKKALGQHFLTDQSIARAIVDSLSATPRILEVGPGMGVLTQYLLQRTAPAGLAVAASGGDSDALPAGQTSPAGKVPPCRAPLVTPSPVSPVTLKVVEIDEESVVYLREHYPALAPGLLQADFLKLPLDKIFAEPFSVIGNFPYNISSQIFFHILDYRELVPEVVCMIQKEVAERLAAGPGSKTYGILSVLLQMWYDIEYRFTVGEGAFVPPPKVKSAVIRLTRNARVEAGCDEALLRRIVKATFGLRRKTLRNSLRSIGITGDDLPFLDERPERLSVGDFIALTRAVSASRAGTPSRAGTMPPKGGAR